MNLTTFNENELLIDRWYRNAGLYPDKDAIVHWSVDGTPFRWTFSSLISTAEKFAVILKKHSIKKGEVCAIIIRHNKYFHPIYFAVSLLGAIPAVLAYPNPRLHPDKFRQGIRGMLQRSGLDWILTEKDLESILLPVADDRKSTIKGMFFPLEWIDNIINFNETGIKIINEINRERAAIQSTDPALLQHSSGTTGLQKPVVLSHKEVLLHIFNYSKAIKLNENDKVVSWLPLYHDMGLIAAYHLPVAAGITTVQINTFEWVIAPGLLLDIINAEKGTLSWVPNFAFNMMAEKIHDDEFEDISLSSLRMLINCSEPVRDESHQKFYNRLKKYGFKFNSIATCYAMAETTFAVTQSEPDKEVTKVSVDRSELAKGNMVISDNLNISRICVSSGKTIDGCQIKIVSDEGKILPEGKVGEIAVKSVSMFDGYRNYSEKTKEVLKGGWYYSGDYGFKWNDEFFVVGRKNDIIIIAGNNIYPEDIEDAVSNIEDIIPGRVVAFGEYEPYIGSEVISVIAETKIVGEEELKKLRLKIKKAGMQIDVTISKVYLVSPRWLIKSSAGKPSRKTNKERILNLKESLNLEV